MFIPGKATFRLVVMIFIEIESAGEQQKLQFHVFYASSECAFVGAVPFHNAEGTLGLNAPIHTQQRAVNRMEVFYDLLVKAGQFLIQSDAAVAFGFRAALFFERAALTAFALIDFLRASVFVAPDRPRRFVKKFLPVRANGISIGVLFEVR